MKRDSNRPLVCHLIQRDGVGGVETAARSMLGSTPDDLDFNLVIMSGDCLEPDPKNVVTLKQPSINHFKSYWRTFQYLKQAKPDILICSLWRMMVIGMAMKFFSRQTKTVCFLHNSRNAHLPDRIITFLATRLLDHVWVDSAATRVGRLNKTQRSLARKISFITKRLSPSSARDGNPEPGFVAWGRFSKVKRFDRAIGFVEKISETFPNATLDIYGPDDGDFENLQSLVEKKALQERVRLHKPVTHDKLPAIAAGKSFFIQCSEREGMAMAVTEAMALGLVPVVTPVGEIAHYCKDGANAIFLNDGNNHAQVDRVIGLLKDKQLYLKLSQNAREVWQSAPLYKDDVLQAVRAIL